jgi:hypothetical protein
MPEEPSKYAENQFLSATAGRFPLMSELLDTTIPRITAAADGNDNFLAPRDAIIAANTAWSAGETVLTNAEASQLGATLALEDRMESMTRMPDANTPSPIETWDVTIRAQVAYGGPAYLILLPAGRETLTGGAYEARLDAVRDFAVRLGEQGSVLNKPVLTTLGTTVAAWHMAARTLRETQETAKTSVEMARTTQETLRVNAARELYAMVGLGIQIFKATPLQVDSLFDVALLRGPSQAVPPPPADTVWTPAERKLSTTALPAGATRLEGWRQGPGGAPELLIVGEQGALEVIIPAEFTFVIGETYELWLQARNSRGSSLPGPKQTWEAE